MSEPSDMSVLGIDLGNWSCYVKEEANYPIEPQCGLLKRGGSNIKTQISQIKSLLGRKLADPELQLELDYVPFRVIEGPLGYPLVHGRCKGEDRAFTPVEILAMLLSTPEFKADCSYLYIGIPIYFTYLQKNDLLQAAKMAGLPIFDNLLYETTAMIAAYKREEKIRLLSVPHCIGAFVDIGHASMQVCFAEFKTHRPTGERSVNIFYQGYARSLGGREFDKVLFNHFASKIRNEYNIDVSENISACVRLSEACESLKHDLSYCYEASFFLEKFLLEYLERKTREADKVQYYL